MNDKKIKVLIVDDSLVSRELLTFMIESDPNLQVIGTADSGHKALELLEKKMNPDIITMDIVMPDIDGFETTKRIMRKNPCPIIVVSGVYQSGDAEKSFKALDAGALAILEKPKGVADPGYKEMKEDLIETIKMMSEIKVITRRYGMPAQKKEKKPIKVDIGDSGETVAKHLRAVAIGASLGGPQALAELLSHIPANFPVPILIVQHIAQGFITGLVNWLKESTSLKISLAKHGEQALPGHVYIAPDNLHMLINRDNIISLVDEPLHGGLRPSVGRLFQSMAKAHGQNCIGIILTGMGSDGVDDLLLMRQKGALTIAQDEESSIIFGMPGEAIRVGAAKRVMSLGEIGSALKQIGLRANNKG